MHFPLPAVQRILAMSSAYLEIVDEHSLTLRRAVTESGTNEACSFKQGITFKSLKIIIFPEGNSNSMQAKRWSKEDSVYRR